jgi:malonyl-CoA O-methyltransferase
MSEDYDKRLLRRRFARAVAMRRHDANALAREIGARMAERLELLRIAPQRILVIGPDSRDETRMLRQRYADSYVVESDLVCARATAPRESWWDRAIGKWKGRFGGLVCADFEALPFADGSFDMVWSNLALQWLASPQRALTQMQRVLRPGGVCMFSTLGPDTLKELRAAYAAADAHVHVHRMIDMHDYGDMMIAARFAEPVIDAEWLTFTYPDVPALLAELRAAGGGNLDIARRRGLTGKNAHRRMLEAYEGMRRDGRIPATFEVVYGHAWRAQQRELGDSRAVVRFHPRISRPTQ